MLLRNIISNIIYSYKDRMSISKGIDEEILENIGPEPEASTCCSGP